MNTTEITATADRSPAWMAYGKWTAASGQGLMTASEAIVAGGLDYTVTKEPLTSTFVTEDGVTTLDVPGKFATIAHTRLDGPRALGVVGNQYHIVQNVDAATVVGDLDVDLPALVVRPQAQVARRGLAMTVCELGNYNAALVHILEGRP